MTPTNGNGIFAGVVPPATLEDQLRVSVELAKAAKTAAPPPALPPPPAISTQPPNNPFRRAVKYDAKLRLAISGPAGSGKTFTLLRLATELGGPIAALDTEHGSMSKYADRFDFDVEELSSYDPEIIPDRIQRAHEAGYRSLLIDSLSHFWTGVGGELDQVDKITARSKSGNSFSAWREVSPKHNRMVDSILSAPIHIMVGMRSKMQWIMVANDKGKMEPKRIGMDSIMRDGIEYEFDVAADMDVEHNFIVSKTRCEGLDGYVANRPGAQVARILSEWLKSPITKPTSTEDLTGMRQHFQSMRERLGDALFFLILGSCGYERIEDIPSLSAGTPVFKELIIAERRNRQ